MKGTSICLEQPKNLKIMLYKSDFSVWFMVQGVRFREEYTLPCRTEEAVYERLEMTTLYQAAKAAIAKDLGVRSAEVCILHVQQIHNRLILE